MFSLAPQLGAALVAKLDPATQLTVLVWLLIGFVAILIWLKLSSLKQTRSPVLPAPRGAIFTTSLPFKTNRRRPLVLYFESDEGLAEMHSFVLSSLGYEIQVMNHVPEHPIQFVAERKPDLILTRIIIAKMDGLALCNLLKADARTLSIPVIGIDNLVDSEILVGARKAGMAAYFVHAGCTPSQLAEQLSKKILPIPTHPRQRN